LGKKGSQKKRRESEGGFTTEDLTWGKGTLVTIATRILEGLARDGGSEFLMRRGGLIK